MLTCAVHVGVGYVHCGCQQLQAVRAVCWFVEATDVSWGLHRSSQVSVHLSTSDWILCAGCKIDLFILL